MFTMALVLIILIVDIIYVLNDESIITSYLEKNGPGIHHIAFLVDNISAAIDYFKNNNKKIEFYTNEQIQYFLDK